MEITEKHPEITNADLLTVLQTQNDTLSCQNDTLSHQNEELRQLRLKLLEHDAVLREHTKYMKDVLKDTGSFTGYLKQFAVNIAADFFGTALRGGRG